LKKVISQQVAATMVLPNKLPIVLSNEIAAHVVKLPEPEVSIIIVNTTFFIHISEIFFDY